MKRLGLPYVVLAMALFLPLTALADHEAGVSAYKRGDFSVALREFRQAAQDSQSESQFNLGLMYVKGQGVAVDFGEGLEWLRRAASQSNADAQGMIGAMYANGEGLPQDFVLALAWISLGVQNGSDRLRQFVPSIAGRMTDDQKAQARIIAARLAETRSVKAQLKIEKEWEDGMILAMAERIARDGTASMPGLAPDNNNPGTILHFDSKQATDASLKTIIFTVGDDWGVAWQAGPANPLPKDSYFYLTLYRGDDKTGSDPKPLVQKVLSNLPNFKGRIVSDMVIISSGGQYYLEIKSTVPYSLDVRKGR